MCEDSRKLLSPKAGYNQHTTPIQNRSSVTHNITPSAMKYWHDELTTKEESTRENTKKTSAEFLQFVNNRTRSYQTIETGYDQNASPILF